MGWNDSNGGRNQDPWKGGRRHDQGPPDLEEVLKAWVKKIEGLLGKRKIPGSGGGAGSANGAGILAIIFVVAISIWAVRGFFTVEEAEKALILRFGEMHKIVGAGLRWRPPIVDQVFKVNTQQVSTLQHEASILTKDLDIVELEIKVQYQVADPEKYFLEAQNSFQSSFRTPFALSQATESTLRHVVGEMEMESIINVDRDLVAPEVELMLQQYLDFYETGLKVAKVNLERADPPAQVEDAFDDVTKARQDRERLVSEAEAYRDRKIPKAEGHAVRLTEEAAAYKESRIAQARGEAERFERLLAEYVKAPKVTRQRLYLETAENVLQKTSKVLVDTEGGQNLIYLPLDRLMSNRGGDSIRADQATANSGGGVQNIVDSAFNRAQNIRGGRTFGEGR